MSMILSIWTRRDPRTSDGWRLALVNGLRTQKDLCVPLTLPKWAQCVERIESVRGAIAWAVAPIKQPNSPFAYHGQSCRENNKTLPPRFAM